MIVVLLNIKTIEKIINTISFMIIWAWNEIVVKYFLIHIIQPNSKFYEFGLRRMC